jgi:hypothetical protein
MGKPPTGEEDGREDSATTILVALLSGGAGAVIGKWLEGRFQRDRDFRTWHLTAAANYTTGVHQALLALRNGYDALLKFGGPRQDGHIETRDPQTGVVRPEIEAVAGRGATACR